MARRPRPGREIKAKLSIDTASMNRLLQKLAQLKEVTREEIAKKALLAGGEIVKNEMITRGPGPGIDMQFKPPADLWKGGADREIKQTIAKGGLYLAVGPDKAHWYYRFTEFGVQPHEVRKRKTTRNQRAARKVGIKRADMAKGKRRAKPVMSWVQGSERIFARKVSGFAAKPFIRPAIDNSAAETTKAIAQVLATEIEKAAR
jgi:HK97 gp10 family phage protein